MSGFAGRFCRRRTCLLGAAWLCAALLSPAAGQAADAPPASVEMVIDYGDGAQLRLGGLRWHDGMTVLEAIEAAGAHPHGAKFKLRGSGSTAFVTQIGDVKNEGGAEKSRNWIYTVDGEQAEVGVGAQTLKAGGVVLWKFGPADYNR